MPRHDFSTPHPQRDVDTRVVFLKRRSPRKRKPGKEKDDGGVPVDPRNPKNLSGGAAAELDFGED